MEHKGNKNLNDYLDDDGQGDFDNLLKEKLKGWKTPSESTILADQKLVPTKGKLPPAESVVEDSSNTSNSNETNAQEESSEPSSVEPVVESSGDIPPPPIKRNVAASELPPDELPSDPDYTRQILEGKDVTPRTSQVSIRGIKSGPWAKQNVVEENLPGDVVLEKLGLPDLQKIWGSAHTFFVRDCEKDVDRLIRHINRLEVAAFRVNLMKEAGRDYLKTLLEGMSADERARAETLVSKMYKEKSDRSKPGVPSQKREKSESKARQLSAAVKKQYDELIDGLGVTYDQILNLLKANPPKDVDLVLAYVKERFNK